MLERRLTSRLGFADGDLLSAADEPNDSTSPVRVDKGDWLALAKKVTESHGGRLLVESQEGKGTIATVRLPAFPGARAPLPNPAG